MKEWNATSFLVSWRRKYLQLHSWHKTWVNRNIELRPCGFLCMGDNSVKMRIFCMQNVKKKLVQDVEILLNVRFSWIPFSGIKGEVENVSANQGPGRPAHFWISRKKKSLVQDVEILLHVRFSWIPFSGIIREVENVSANQGPGWPSCFSKWPQQLKLGRGLWGLVFWQVLLNSVQQFQRSRKCLSQSEAQWTSCFS